MTNDEPRSDEEDDSSSSAAATADHHDTKLPNIFPKIYEEEEKNATISRLTALPCG